VFGDNVLPVCSQPFVDLHFLHNIKEYVTEFGLDREFQNSIEDKRAAFHKSRRFSWGYGIGNTLGLVLYIICRKKRPDIVVETGVASGVSSSHILGALEQNKQGQLYSIDLSEPQENQSGWLIPDYLRYRWHLIVGKSSEKLAPLLKKLSWIDIFLHDSDHSYQNMFREFQTVWPCLKGGGLLLSHNIDYNEAFSDFYRDRSTQGYYLEDMGGIIKT
jgi:predicted O-methyltransferase YrrM